ncbi:DUF2130 domain-containing protein [Saccharicrinis sp. FJH54]|uniref:DUF2130 domain-containing protein n=1 Tax=Saccharicrinis sp. FJH54 TaxID=3344665 RepID=UPI0035D48083
MDKKSENQVSCPNCGYAIDVNAILYQQMEEDFKHRYQNYLSEERRKFKKLQDDIENERKLIEEQKEGLEKKVEEDVKIKLRNEKEKLESELRKSLKEEQEEVLESMRKELLEKSEKVKELNKKQAEIERLKREKEELKDVIEAEAQKKINEEVAKERERLEKMAVEKSELRLREKDTLINQLKEQVDEMKRKAEQGSMQMQGEVQELAIEEFLREQFPLDSIEEVRKGVRGADCKQIVNTRTHQNCGVIYYESKRTKDFQPAWIEKFRNDMRDMNANIGVIVTEAMPKDMDRMGLKDGIWICNYIEFKGLCAVLRESLVQLSQAVASQENKGDKMVMLYDYLTSNEFRLQIEAIVEGFTEMQNDLDRERRAMEGAWKRREKQIQKVLLNTNHMYHSVRGIAGNAIAPVQALEMPDEE